MVEIAKFPFPPLQVPLNPPLDPLVCTWRGRANALIVVCHDNDIITAVSAESEHGKGGEV